jgi:hypothetical protein
MTGYIPESTDSLSSGSWVPKPGNIVETETEFQTTIPGKLDKRYWRLREPQ